MNHLESAGFHSAVLSPIALRFSLQNGEAHGTHQTRFIHLFSHMNLHFVSPGLPDILWRGEHEVATVVFQRNVHGILSDHYGGIEAGYRFREATSEHFESLIMLMEAEHDEDRRSIGTKPVSRL